MQKILEIHNLTKRYGKTLALDGLSLSIHQGEVFGLLGPNGSGKTTTLGIILGILKKEQGDFSWFENQYGNDYNLKIGAILETPNFYPYLDAVDNLNIIKHIKKSKNDNIDELLTLVELKERKFSKFRTYSLGMKQRLAIAATLIGNPEVLIFDEPTNGLDPQGIAEVRNILKRIAETGKTVIMASHMLDEVEKICDHVAILKKGKLLASGRIGEILNDEKTIEISADNFESLQTWVLSTGWNHKVDEKTNKITVFIDKNTDHTIINQKAFDAGIILNHIVMKKKRLEEEFLHITKN